MRVDLFRCDVCRRESKDTTAWARVLASSFQEGAWCRLIVKQPLHHPPVPETSHVDLCSRECAGRWLFGEATK